MSRDNPDNTTLPFPVLSVFRGLYQRVAAKLQVDPSFVSRVARGERRSPAVVAALQEEMKVIREHLNQLDGLLNGGSAKDGRVDGIIREVPAARSKSANRKSANSKPANSKLEKRKPKLRTSISETEAAD